MRSPRQKKRHRDLQCDRAGRRAFRQPRSIVTVRLGCVNRHFGGRKPEHRGAVADRQSSRDAVARSREVHCAGLVFGPGRRPGRRRSPHRQGQPVGSSTDHVSRGRRANAAFLPGAEVPLYTPFKVNYAEGAEVGYRWFVKTNAKPSMPPWPTNLANFLRTLASLPYMRSSSGR
jgi:hypothetical protein